MPAKKKVTREVIIASAFSILRENGIDAVNARSISKKIGCSTQPIYLEFNGMEELLDELRKTAGEFYRSEVERFIKKNNCAKYTAYGLGFIHLARKEKMIFRYLYMREEKDTDSLFFREDLADVLEALHKEFGYSLETAAKFHVDMALYCQGIAFGLNIGTLKLTDEEVMERMMTEFKALSTVYSADTHKCNRKKE